MESSPTNNNTVTIAVTGCVHGCIQKMYNDIQSYSKLHNKHIDLVLCTGDFECMISKNDLNYLSCPPKYKHMGDFYKYYEGYLPTPYTTIFIGGNHEASNILNDHFYGGYICDKIYYLGRSGVVKYKGVRIAGVSGIFNVYDYKKGYYERNLLEKGNMKSVFHVREFDIVKLAHLTGSVDVMVSHDWPSGVVDVRDVDKVSGYNCDLKNELIHNELGSYGNEYLLKHIKPKRWICGHMHYYYTNKVNGVDVCCLDKCLHKRKYFEVIDVDVTTVNNDVSGDSGIYVDGEWIAINKALNKVFPNEKAIYDYTNYFPNKEMYINTTNKVNSINSYLKVNDTYRDVNYDEFINELNGIKKEVQDVKVEMNVDQYTTMIEIFGIVDKHYCSYNKCSNESVTHKYNNKEEIQIDI